MRVTAIVALAAALVACGSSDDDPEPAASNAPSSSSMSSSPSASPSAASGVFAGKWKFTVHDVRKTFGTGHFAAATVTYANGRVTLKGSSGSSSSYGVPASTETIDCRGICSYGIVGFQPEGSAYRVINAATLEPYHAAVSGSAFCGAPPVPELGLVKDLTRTSFSFVAGQSENLGGGTCAQVLWTVKATKVA